MKSYSDGDVNVGLGVGGRRGLGNVEQYLEAYLSGRGRSPGSFPPFLRSNCQLLLGDAVDVLFASITPEQIEELGRLGDSIE
jgi:hypothetical protein